MKKNLGCWSRLGLLILVGFTAIEAHAVEAPPPVALNFRAGINATEGQGIAVADSGVIYVTGQYVNTGTFGSFTLTNGGAEDYFLAAYNPTGQVLWVERSGTSGSDYGSSVALDHDGNVIVVGVIQGTNDFNGTIAAGLGKKDMFIAKYSTNGALAWVRLAGSTENDYGIGLAVDNANNYFIGGRIGGVATIGNSVGAAGQVHSVLAKYDSNGQALWARDLGSADSVATSGVAVDAIGNAYFCGSSVYPPGPFIAKYDANGNSLWTSVAPGTSYFNENTGIAVDSSGNVYVAGRCTLTPFTIGSTTLTSSNNSGVGYIAKYNSNGAALWAIPAGDRGFDVALASDGTPYVTGFSYGTDTILGTETLSNQGGLDVFVAKLTPNGEVVWVKSAGTGGNDLGRAVTLSAGGSVFATGEGGNSLFGDPAFPGGVFIVEFRPTVAPPQLRVEISGTNLMLSWPPEASGYVIETTTTLGSPFEQGNVIFTPVSGQTNAYSTPKPDFNLFIRIAKP